MIRLLCAVLLIAYRPDGASAQSSSAADSVPAAASVELTPALAVAIREGTDAAKRADWGTAIERFVQGHLIALNHPVPLYNLGLAHLSVGDPAAAIAWWEAYLVAAPDAENATRVRAEITRLHDSAAKSARAYLDEAHATLAHLSGRERDLQQRFIQSDRDQVLPTLAVLASPVDDSVRAVIARRLTRDGQHAGAIAYAAGIRDSALRDSVLTEGAHSLARFVPLWARRYAVAIADATTRGLVTAKIDEEQRALRADPDSAVVERLRRGTYPTEEVAASMSRGGAYAPGGYKFRELVATLARHGFHGEAEQLIQTVAFPEREDLLQLLAAARLRAADLHGAGAYAREILVRAAVPRNEVRLAADAVRRAARGDVDRALQVVVSRIGDVRVQGHALGAISNAAKSRGDDALAGRVKEMRRQLSGSAPNASMNVLALAISGDYEAALFVAGSQDPDELRMADPYNEDGTVYDLLDRAWGGPEVNYAHIAFVATARGDNAEARRAIALATHPVHRYRVYRNVPWALAIAGRFGEALEDVARWPSPPPGVAEAVRSYEWSRAQVLAAIATRAALAGKPHQGEQALAAMRAVRPAPRAAVIWAALEANATMEVADAHARMGDSTSASRLYAATADVIQGLFTDARGILGSLRGGSGGMDHPHVARAIARLRAVDPAAASRVATRQRRDIAIWSAVAMDVTALSPRELLQNRPQEDPRQLPQLYSLAALNVAISLVRIRGAEAEIAAIQP